jgi:hypothetical protein
MKPFNPIFLLAILLLLADCNSQQTEDERGVELSISSKVYTDRINSSTVFLSIRCIPLETNSNLLIDDAVKILHRDHFIYVADRYALYRFDEDGQSCGKIQQNGAGPEEYNSISDFEINADQTVWILSRTNRMLYKYAWDGVLKEKVKMNYWVTKLCFVGQEKICVYIGNEMDENNRHQLKTVDLRADSVINNHLEIDTKKAHYLHVHSPSHFSRVFGRKNEIYFFTMFDDVIYKWTNDKLKSAFRMNINRKNIPPSFYDNDYADVFVFFQTLHKNDYAYGTDLFIEYEKDYICAYFYGGERHFSFISRDTREAIYDFKTIVEDVALSGYPIRLTEQSYFIQENCELILPLIPSDIIEYAKNHLDEENRLKVQQCIRYANEDQNPVLLIVNR